MACKPFDFKSFTQSSVIICNSVEKMFLLKLYFLYLNVFLCLFIFCNALKYPRQDPKTGNIDTGKNILDEIFARRKSKSLDEESNVNLNEITNDLTVKIKKIVREHLSKWLKNRASINGLNRNLPSTSNNKSIDTLTSGYRIDAKTSESLKQALIHFWDLTKMPEALKKVIGMDTPEKQALIQIVTSPDKAKEFMNDYATFLKEHKSITSMDKSSLSDDQIKLVQTWVNEYFLKHNVDLRKIKSEYTNGKHVSTTTTENPISGAEESISSAENSVESR